MFTTAHPNQMERYYWKARRLWSGPYFTGSVGGAPLSVVRQYIERQIRPVGGATPPA